MGAQGYDIQQIAALLRAADLQSQGIPVINTIMLLYN